MLQHFKARFIHKGILIMHLFVVRYSMLNLFSNFENSTENYIIL
jgi:hypothetical protein